MKRLNHHLVPAETKLESKSTNQRLLKQIEKLRQQGLSLRAIGQKLGISHTTVQRLSQEPEGSETKYFYWSDDEKLTRLEIQRRLRQIAKSEQWDKDSLALAKWEEQILRLVCGGAQGDSQKVAYLMATGPSRRGRKLPKDHGILLDESLGKRVSFFDDYCDQDENGLSIPIDFGDWQRFTNVFSSKAEPYLKPPSPPRAPLGSVPLECPRCRRMTLFQEPPCRVLEDDGGWKLCQPRIGFRSKRCKAGSCDAAPNSPPTELPTKTERRVRLVKH